MSDRADDRPAAEASGGSEVSDDQAILDLADLNAGLHDLSALVTDSMGLPDLLAQVARSATLAIPGADGAGVTLLRADRRENIVHALAASDPFVSEIDDIQYRVINEGPCITAARERRTVRSGDLAGDSRWPRFGPRIGKRGVRSVLSLPLLLQGELAGQLVGAINVYGRATDVFDNHAAEMGEAFARPAAVAVHNAHVLAAAQTLTAQLQNALSSRPVIDQAIGILRGRSGATAEEALASLREASQRENVKIVTVAERVVAEAVGRARSRHTEG